MQVRQFVKMLTPDTVSGLASLVKLEVPVLKEIIGLER
jgi:hypothetical protein